MAVFETWIESDLQKMIVPRALPGNAFCMDSGANLIGVSVMDGGEPATLSGTVAGKVVRSDGTTVPVTGGTLSGNRASIVLPQRAYEVPGPIAIAVTLTSGSTVTTIGAVTGYVVRSQTDSIIDPGTILPTIDTLINQIQTAIDSIPADYSQVIHSIAPSFSSSTAYSAGDMVWYPGEATNPGALYQFTSAHAAGDWTGSDATATVFANELSALKSAFDTFSEPITETDKTKYYSGAYLIDPDGDVSSSTAFEAYKIADMNFLAIEFTSYNNYTNRYAIAFYSSLTTFNTTTFLGGIHPDSATGATVAKMTPSSVPQGTKTIFMASRIASGTAALRVTYSGTLKAISKNVEDIKTISESFESTIKKYHPRLAYTAKQGDSNVLRGYHVHSGPITSTTDYMCCTENFIECNNGDVFLLLNCESISKYTSDTDTSFTAMVQVSNTPLFSGNGRWNVWIADFNGYVRFSMYWTEPVMCAVSKINLTEYPYECVCLGDSIFGNNQKPNDLPTYMQEISMLQTANCGFGGTEAATHFNPIYTPLSFWKIADAINSGDWSDIDVDWYAINNDHVFMANVYILCHLVDWSKVRTLTVAYGTNDWNAGVRIDNESNSKDVTTYKGALRYGIEKIQSAYPKINIIMLSPLFRYWSNSQDYSTVDDDSDNRINAGRKLTDYVTAMKEVAEEYHIPFFDNYNTAGINKITAPSILRDGTHLNYKYGVSMVGKHIGAEVAMSNRAIDGDY